MEGFLMAANLLYVAAYFTQDILRLRLMTLLAACLLAIYFYSQSQPMYSVVAWNLFFVVLNLWQIGRVLRARFGWKRTVPEFGGLGASRISASHH